MNILRNKSKASTVALVLVLTITATLVALPIVNAHDPPWTVPTWSYISLVPNDYIGVGQEVVVVYWCNIIMPTAQGAYGDRWTFTVEVTKPDDSKQTLGPYTTDPVGGGYTLYTPDQVGTYTFVATMDDHVITGEPFPPTGFPWGTSYINDTFLGSTSEPVSLTVQQDPREGWPETPLPTDYWTRPINAMNRDWSQVAANWLDGAAQRNGPTTDFQWGWGPESPHIMWTTPMWAGGVMDARFGPIGYQTSHYQGMSFTPGIILNGRIFYNVRHYPRYGWYCIDLYTGEELFFHNTTGPVTKFGWFDDPGALREQSLSYGQIYNYDSPNQHGGFPYLWSTTGPTPNTWMLFDGYTGRYICSIANVSSSGTAVYGKDGSILRYRISGPSTDRRLTVWNTSRAIWYEDYWGSNEYWMWRPDLFETFDGRNGFSLNVSIPSVSGSIRAVREGEFIIGGTEGRYNDEELTQANLWCLSLKPGQEGTLLWNRTFTPPYGVPADALQGVQFSSRDVEMGIVDPEDGVVFFNQEMTREWWCYNLTTGQLKWGPTEPENQMNFYGMSSKVYDGKLLTYGYSGELIAYDIETGAVEWTYNATGVGFEAPYGYYPLRIGAICDGKIYTYTSEHSDTHPLYRGPNLRCLDAETGAELWKLAFFDADMAIADGFLVALNSFDMQIYCIGKGPSATTVSGPETVVPFGDSVLIKGTVTDQSPGAKGTPAIADEDMQAWMEYLYQQQAIPATAKGVEVTLDAVDPNGNFINIGKTTSDMSGTFSHMWTPEVPGRYTIIATFEGSKSYWPSYAETAIGVSEAPEAPPEPEPEEEPAYTAIDLAIIAAVAVAIVIGIVNLWALRKRS